MATPLKAGPGPTEISPTGQPQDRLIAARFGGLLSSRHPVPIKRLGILDVYAESGPNEALLDKYRLPAGAVAGHVETWLRQQPSQRPLTHLEGSGTR